MSPKLKSKLTWQHKHHSITANVTHWHKHCAAQLSALRGKVAELLVILDREQSTQFIDLWRQKKKFLSLMQTQQLKG